MTTLVSKIRQSIPTYIQESYPEFVNFLITYYTYLETEGVVSELLRFEENIYGYKDDPDYVRRFLSELGFDIGVNLDLEPNLQYKLINDFFAMRGSEPSLKLLFRMLFNADVSVEYPRDHLLYPSFAHYTQNIFLITSAPDNIVLPDISFAGIIGLTSKSTASVENIDIIVAPDQKRYYLIECSFASDDFLLDEVIRILADNQEIDVINVGAFDIDVQVCGNGYKLFDSVNISGCIQTGVGYVSAITNGPIEEITISKAGTGYKEKEVIMAVNGLYAVITEVDANGGILKVILKHGGYKYKEYPELKILSPDGSGAELVPYGSQVGGVKKITFDNPYALCNNSIISISSVSGYGFQGEAKLVPKVKLNKWTDEKGVLGINSMVQDSDTYHEFAYHIVSGVPSDKYIDLVDKFTHPYGFIRVPILRVQVGMDFNLTTQKSTVGAEREYDKVTDIELNNIPETLQIEETKELSVNVTVERVTEVLF